MGLFSFIKNAGAKLGIGKSTAEEAAEKKAEAAAAAAAANKKAEASLKETIGDLGLEVENLDIDILGELATVTGKAKIKLLKKKLFWLWVM